MTTEVAEQEAATQTAPEATQATETQTEPEDVKEFFDGKTEPDGTERQEAPAQNASTDPELDALIDAEATKRVEDKLEQERQAAVTKKAEDDHKAEAQSRQNQLQKDYRDRAASVRGVLSRLDTGELELSTRLQLPGTPTVREYLERSLDAHHAVAADMGARQATDFLWEETAKRLPEDKRESFLASRPKDPPNTLAEFDREWKALLDGAVDASRNGHVSASVAERDKRKAVVEYRENWFSRLRGDGSDSAIEAGLASLRSQLKGGSRLSNLGSTPPGQLSMAQIDAMPTQDWLSHPKEWRDRQLENAKR